MLNVTHWHEYFFFYWSEVHTIQSSNDNLPWKLLRVWQVCQWPLWVVPSQAPALLQPCKDTLIAQDPSRGLRVRHFCVMFYVSMVSSVQFSILFRSGDVLLPYPAQSVREGKLTLSSLDVQVSPVTARWTLRSTSPLPPVVVPHPRHLRPLLCRPGQWQAARRPPRLRGSRCRPWSRCSRNRTASRQSRSLRVWIQWGSSKRGSTGAWPYIDYITHNKNIWTVWLLKCIYASKHSIVIIFLN